MWKNSKKAVGTNRPVRVRLQYAPQLQEWARVRKRLLEFPAHFYPQQAAELVDCCCRSAVLRRVMPYVSLGRLGLALTRSSQGGPLSTNDSPCLYFHEGRYIVSSYDNEAKWPFDTAAEATAFAEKHLIVVPQI
ncbi:DUF6193 family natural product biosynthesis protein [Hymenobacter sp.]|jgi:hypothetical protein|uniref:DUF6193 family natural product biosynthesis protein n=1 Tax=Hymenobacter sp. TaxID=1898978 RepID=UPI0039C869DA